MLVTAKNLPKWLIAAWLIFTSGIHCHANMRAAVYRNLGTSGALRPVGGLTLKSEQISFTFDGVYLGPKVEVDDHPKSCRVEVIYHLSSRSEQEALFDFISPSADAASAQINGKEVGVVATAFEDPKQEGSPSRNILRKRFSLTFHGALLTGANTVAVTYTQPLSASEFGLSYISRSRWQTFAEYEFWPIKEWARDEDFKAEVALSVPRTRSLRESVFGPKLILSAGERTRGADSQSTTAIPCTFEKTRDRLVTRFTLSGKTLPDILTVSAAEK